MSVASSGSPLAARWRGAVSWQLPDRTHTGERRADDQRSTTCAGLQSPGRATRSGLATRSGPRPANVRPFSLFVWLQVEDCRQCWILVQDVAKTHDAIVGRIIWVVVSAQGTPGAVRPSHIEHRPGAGEHMSADIRLGLVGKPWRQLIHVVPWCHCFGKGMRRVPNHSTGVKGPLPRLHVRQMPSILSMSRPPPCECGVR